MLELPVGSIQYAPSCDEGYDDFCAAQLTGARTRAPASRWWPAAQPDLMPESLQRGPASTAPASLPLSLPACPPPPVPASGAPPDPASRAPPPPFPAPPFPAPAFPAPPFPA